jgi:nucleolar protein 6
VRLLTPKVTRTGATVAKSKGCAFLEFSAKPALQAALRLHQSELDGRRINVELTAGGGGRGDSRLAKLKARNKDLAAQRVRQSPRIAQLLTTYSPATL